MAFGDYGENFGGFGGDVQRLRQQNIFAPQPQESAGYNVDFGMNDMPVMRGSPTYQQAAPSNPYDVDFGVPTFDPGQSQGALSRIGSGGQTLDQEIAERIRIMNEFYSPETEASDRLSGLLNNVPQRTDPNIWQRIIAGGLAVGPNGQQAAENYVSGPYNRDMADWTAQVNPAYNAANLERNNNTNERTLMNNMLTNIAAQRKLDEQQRHAQETELVARKNAESTRIVAMARDFQAHNWRVDFDGPNVIAVSPDGQEMRTLGPTGNLSEEAKLDIQNRAAMARTQANNTGAMNRTIAAGATGYVDSVTGQEYGWNPRAPQQPPVTVNFPGAGPGGVERIGTSRSDGGQLEDNRVQNAKYLDATSRYPELRKWYVQPTTANGNWMMAKEPQPKDVSWNPFAADVIDPNEVTEYNRARQMVGLPPWNPQLLPGAAPSAPQSAAPVAPTGAQQGERVRVRNRQTGQTGWIPAGNAEAAINSGTYERIQ